MFEVIGKSAVLATACVVMCVANAVPQEAGARELQVQETRDVDIVIALDVSGSMSGLIESAKQRLWDVVNELGRAQPQPDLRIAIMTYGNPQYGADNGYVRIDLPFTSNLDAVNRTLFSFGTDGGDEYVARVIQKSVQELDWSQNDDALRILFVAGNEQATQDPSISIPFAAQAAANAGIVVNTIYCGAENDAIATGWRDVAALTNGLYASIDQNTAAVANIATPMDQELANLNRALNETYIAYGEQGRLKRDNQLEQDANAASMSPSAMASRAITKASALYDSIDWDIVGAVEAGTELEEIEVEDLPADMQAMDNKEREQYVADMVVERQALQAEIGKLDEDRRDYIAAERSRRAAAQATGLDEVMQDSIRTQAESKGFTFD